MGSIYFVELNFLNLKCYVFKMFVPNFNKLNEKWRNDSYFKIGSF